MDWSTSGGQLVATPGSAYVNDSNYSVEVDVAIPANVISNNTPITIETSNTSATSHSRGPVAGNVVTNSNRVGPDVNLRHWTEWGLTSERRRRISITWALTMTVPIRLFIL